MRSVIKTNNAKDRIIKAAISCFIEYGIKETKLIQIAKKAKMGHSLVLYHFPTIDELSISVINNVLKGLKEETIFAVEQNRNDPKKLLHAYIKAPFKWAKKNPEKFNIWLYFYYLASFSGIYQKMNSEIRNTGRNRIRDILYFAIAKNYIERLLDNEIETLTTTIQGVITGNVILSMTEEKGNIDKNCGITIKAIERLLGI